MLAVRACLLPVVLLGAGPRRSTRPAPSVPLASTARPKTSTRARPARTARPASISRTRGKPLQGIALTAQRASTARRRPPRLRMRAPAVLPASTTPTLAPTPSNIARNARRGLTTRTPDPTTLATARIVLRARRTPTRARTAPMPVSIARRANTKRPMAHRPVTGARRASIRTPSALPARIPVPSAQLESTTEPIARVLPQARAIAPHALREHTNQALVLNRMRLAMTALYVPTAQPRASPLQANAQIVLRARTDRRQEQAPL